MTQYEEGYDDGYDDAMRIMRAVRLEGKREAKKPFRATKTRGKTTRKPSKYNLFFKKLTKQPKYKKMNNTRRLKAIGVAWRKTPAGKKK
jgi:hypothetical protein